MRIDAAGLLSVKGKDKASNTRRYRFWNKNKIKKGPTGAQYARGWGFLAANN